ncbi:hypothetical protein D3C81_1426440 [compost metagenome]
MVEARILDGLRIWIEDYKAQWDDTSEKSTSKVNDQKMLEAKETIVKASSKNLDKLKSQAENLDDLLEQGLYTKEKYIERANKLNGRIKEAESALTAATTEFGEAAPAG